MCLQIQLLSEREKRKEKSITFHASAELLKEGIAFNDEMNRMFGVTDSGIPKGVYHFKNHQEANAHQEACIVARMALIAKDKFK